MNKRSVIFGAGIGIIITAFVFFLGLKLQVDTVGETQIEYMPLSDDEIIEKAKRLGLVMVKDLPQETDQNTEMAALTDEMIIERAKALGYIHIEDVASSNINEEDNLQENNLQEDNLQENHLQEDDLSQANLNEVLPEIVSITIPRGSSSTSIGNILFRSGLIDDVEVFTRYVIDRGVSTKLSAGTYELILGTSLEEITDILLKEEELP